MNSPSSTYDRDPFERFENFIESIKEEGWTCRGEKVEFFPSFFLCRHWTQQEIIRVLNACNQLAATDAQVVREKYRKVLSILVYMSTPTEPKLHYLANFLMLKCDDHSLPWTGDANSAVFNGINGRNDFQDFKKYQWRFCPMEVKLDKITMVNFQLQPDQVFALTPETSLQPLSGGGPGACLTRMKLSHNPSQDGTKQSEIVSTLHYNF